MTMNDEEQQKYEQIQDSTFYTKYWLESNSIEIKGNLQLITPCLNLDFDELVTRISNDLLQERIKFNKEVQPEPRLPESIESKKIELTMANLALDRKMEDFRKLQIELKHDPELSFDTSFDKFLQSILGRTPTKLESSVVKHWLWQVKRKLYSKEVTNHLFLLLFSRRQGTGKTRAIESLTSIFQNRGGLARCSVKDLTDKNLFPTIAKNYIGFCDEMSKAGKADVETLKNVVTSAQLENRTFYTQRSIARDNKCSFIGCSNQNLDTLIQDEGMRRFFQLNCAEQDFDYVTLNSINYLELWQSINEDLDEGYVASMLDELRAEQEKLTTKNPIDEWMDKTNFLPDDQGFKAVSFEELYGNFKDFLEANSYFAVTSQKFSSMIREVQKDRQVVNGRKVTVYLVNRDFKAYSQSVDVNGVAYAVRESDKNAQF